MRREPRIVRPMRRPQQPVASLRGFPIATAIAIGVLMLIVILSSLVPDWTTLR